VALAAAGIGSTFADDDRSHHHQANQALIEARTKIIIPGGSSIIDARP